MCSNNTQVLFPNLRYLNLSIIQYPFIDYNNITDYGLNTILINSQLYKLAYLTISISYHKLEHNQLN